ncbi:uncharacterized protein EURHEDRAFT_410817 [Aspergillus ruber CBS 135680]|uniref:Uncharacterized protein n=1 Tax=Aspergillus ruber (strain CBS 135680) TaxID=1388766 RepID=A0A017SK73_ASPRC|nr:uncharacterized protein EURHEDRAFT_410817 [Aspergillus ruber CBS 135680]EYE97019.1 hypothetical protein EURHEDRAFT_410817 [Aspergillus ruber CBS 135680]
MLSENLFSFIATTLLSDLDNAQYSTPVTARKSPAIANDLLKPTEKVHYCYCLGTAHASHTYSQAAVSPYPRGLDQLNSESPTICYFLIVNPSFLLLNGLNPHLVNHCLH